MAGKPGRSGTNRNPDYYCQATSKRTGQQCTRYAAKGLHVCKMHGGSGEAVEIAAFAGLTPEQIVASCVGDDSAARALLLGARGLAPGPGDRTPRGTSAEGDR